MVLIFFQNLKTTKVLGSYGKEISLCLQNFTSITYTVFKNIQVTHGLIADLFVILTYLLYLFVSTYDCTHNGDELPKVCLIVISEGHSFAILTILSRIRKQHVPLIISKFVPNCRESYLIIHQFSVQLLTDEQSVKSYRGVEVEFYSFCISQLVEILLIFMHQPLVSR